MVRIFLTGATGFVGGEALYSLYNATKIKNGITVLLRDSSKAPQIKARFPEVQVVQGDLEDAAVIEEQASKADAVFHLASTKHAPSSEAIVRGLSRREKPGYWVQMSGASMFSGPDIADGTYGEAPSDVYNDVKDAEKIQKVIKNNPARIVDQLVLGQDASKIKTALIIGPLIYGISQGPGNTRSIQIPELTRATLQKGEGFRIGAGKSAWSNIHIHDLGLFFTSLLEAIVSEKQNCWNDNGLYFVENGKLTFGEIGAAIAAEAHKQGLIKSAEVKKELSPDEANEVTSHGAVLLATNAVGESQRARSLLGWKPVHKSPLDTLEEVVKLEAKRLK